MVIVLIRRFIKPEKESEFLEKYRAQAPVKNPAFKGETLTKLAANPEMPLGLRSFAVGKPQCVTYVNVAKWDSWEAFAEEFPPDEVFDAEIETAPRERAVLEAVPNDSSG